MQDPGQLNSKSGLVLGNRRELEGGPIRIISQSIYF